MEQEPVLAPDLEICDPHHHLWEYPESVYLLEQLDDDASGLRVTSTVFVECGSKYRSDGPPEARPVGETEWVRGLASAFAGSRTVRFAEGIVAFADLALGAPVGDVLDAHLDAGQGRLRGIRHVSAWDASADIRASHTNPPPGLLGSDGFRAGFAELEARELSFDAWLYFPQIPELTGLARAFPGTTIILDHLGGPIGIGPYAGRRDENRAVWKTAMAELSTCANVVVKVGGIGMPIFGEGWHHAAEPPGSEEVARVWGPDIRWVIETFGPDRCMFESNFPVDRASVSYRTLWNAFVRISEGLDRSEIRTLFRDTAVRTYRLS